MTHAKFTSLVCRSFSHLRDGIKIAGCCLLILAAPALVRGDEEPGLPKLDKALQLKLDARRMADLDEVVRLCEQSLEEGMSESNQAFARDFMSATLYEKADRLAQTLDDAPINLAWVQRRQLALITIAKSLEVDPERAEAYLLKAELHQVAGAAEREEGVAAARKAVELLADNPARRADALVVEASFTADAEAQLKLLQEALADTPDNLEALKARGAAYASLERWDEALADFQAILRENKRDIDTLQTVARILVTKDKSAEALDIVGDAIANQPDEPANYTLRSGIYIVQEKFDLARADLDRALELNPRSVATLLARARMFEMMENYDEAMADATRALEVEPGLIQALLVRCEIAISAQNYPRAISDLRRLLREAPQDVGLRMRLAGVYLADNDPQMAESVYEQILSDHPQEWLALQGLADARLNQGDHASAIKDYERVLEGMPDNDGVLNNLAWVLATSTIDELRDGKRAIELAERACELTEYKAAHILSTLAAGYAETGDYDKAIEWSTKAVELGEGEVKQQLAAELESYRQKKPWRERQLPPPAEDGSLAADLELGDAVEASEGASKPESSTKPEGAAPPGGAAGPDGGHPSTDASSTNTDHSPPRNP